MKRIALFCDGTWNDAADPNPTNVYLLSQSVAPSDGATAQIAEYFQGVGTDGNRISGGAWGRGLDQIVLQVYRKLCEHYEVGDQIFIFGFSRGAYTARSVCGMLRSAGVLRREHIGRAEEAMQIYRRRDGGGVDNVRATAFRAQYAASSVDPNMLIARPGDVRGQPERMLRIRYLGVWDTVGALGVPERIPFSSLINRRHRFHDCDLSTCVEYARHALAIDETRTAFEPSPWSQESINEINNIHREIRVEQDWFPGDHGSVGGGGEIRALSSGAMLWIAEGAERAGLVFDDHSGHIARARTEYDPIGGELSNSRRSNWMMNLRGQGPRTNGAPMRTCDVSEGTIRRIRESPTYLGDSSERTQWRRRTLTRLLRVLDTRGGA